jgi:hypothetical protein
LKRAAHRRDVTGINMHVDPRDKRWSKLVSWLANEHKILEQSLGRRPTAAEHRAHVHAFIDMVFDDEEKILADAAARAAAAAAAKVVPFVPSPAQR